MTPGIDGRKIDPVALRNVEVDDDVSTDMASDGIEDEKIGATTTLQAILA